MGGVVWTCAIIRNFRKASNKDLLDQTAYTQFILESLKVHSLHPSCWNANENTLHPALSQWQPTRTVHGIYQAQKKSNRTVCDVILFNGSEAPPK